MYAGNNTQGATDLVGVLSRPAAVHNPRRDFGGHHAKSSSPLDTKMEQFYAQFGLKDQANASYLRTLADENGNVWRKGGEFVYSVTPTAENSADLDHPDYAKTRQIARIGVTEKLEDWVSQQYGNPEIELALKIHAANEYLARPENADVVAELNHEARKKEMLTGVKLLGLDYFSKTHDPNGQKLREFQDYFEADRLSSHEVEKHLSQYLQAHPDKNKTVLDIYELFD